MKSSDHLAAIRGNADFKRDAAALLDSARPPQGLLVSAPDGCGRNFAASLLAAAYLRDSAGLVRKLAHPDFIVVEGEGASGQIPVRAVRAAEGELALSAVVAEGRRCCLIKDAFNLNPSSSAALLKILEEPPEGVMFILTARSVSDLIPTVRSRLSALSLLPAGERETAFALKESFPKSSAQELERLSRLSCGRIGTALKLASSELERQLASLANEACLSANAGDSLHLMSLLDSLKTRAQLSSFFAYLLLCISRELEENPKQALKLGRVHEAALEALRGISKNLNQKLLCTRFALRCGENGSI